MIGIQMIWFGVHKRNHNSYNSPMYSNISLIKTNTKNKCNQIIL